MSDAQYTVRVRDVATALGVSRITVQRMCESGELPCVRVRRGKGTPWMICADWLSVLRARTAQDRK